MSGATFSPSGRLVVFTNCTPSLPSIRTASALQDALLAAPRGAFAPVVTQYALPNLVPCNPALALQYKLCAGAGVSLAHVCQHNAAAAQSFQLPSVARAWRTIGAMLANAGHLDPVHPLARATVESILRHFYTINDVQTVACIVRVLFVPPAADVSSADDFEAKLSAKIAAKSAAGGATGTASALLPELASGKRRNTVTEAPQVPLRARKSEPPKSATAQLGLAAVSAFRARTSRTTNSQQVSEQQREQQLLVLQQQQRQQQRQYAKHRMLEKRQLQHRYELPQVNLLDPALLWRNVSLLHAYAEWCLCMGLHSHRAELLQPFRVLSSPAPKKGLSFEPTCAACNRNLIGRHCVQCNRDAFACSLCQLPVRGLVSVCGACGHGGHVKVTNEKQHPCRASPNCPPARHGLVRAARRMSHWLWVSLPRQGRCGRRHCRQGKEARAPFLSADLGGPRRSTTTNATLLQQSSVSHPCVLALCSMATVQM